MCDCPAHRDLVNCTCRCDHTADRERQLRAEVRKLTQQINVDSDYEALLLDERDHLAGQLDRVRELHKPVRGMGGLPLDGSDYGAMFPVCSSCGTASEYAKPWPCPTILAIDGAAS